MRVGVQQPRAARPGEQEADEPQPGGVALLLGAVRDDLGQRPAGQPFGHQHPAGVGDHARHVDVGVVRVGLGEALLGRRLQPVVQLLRHPTLQLLHHGPDLQARVGQGEDPQQLGDPVVVAQQGLAGVRVLDLDGDLPAVVPAGPVHLPDGRRRLRSLVEPVEQLPPGRAQLLGQHAVQQLDPQRRCRLLELGERGPVQRGHGRWQRRLEDREQLPHLHRAALELAEHREQLLGRTALELLGERLGGLPEQPPAGLDRRSPRVPERESGQPGRAGHRPPRDPVRDPVWRAIVVPVHLPTSFRCGCDLGGAIPGPMGKERRRAPDTPCDPRIPAAIS